MIVDADIAWVDMQRTGTIGEAVLRARHLKWLFTILAGIDFLDLPALRRQGTIVTNGTGINALAVAEYAVMGILAAAKRFDEVVRIADRHEWTLTPPGQIELFETRALIVGYGTIGALIGERLKAFGVEVTGVTRSGRDGTLTPDAWAAKIGDYGWVILGGTLDRRDQGADRRGRTGGDEAERLADQHRAGRHGRSGCADRSADQAADRGGIPRYGEPRAAAARAPAMGCAEHDPYDASVGAEPDEDVPAGGGAVPRGIWRRFSRGGRCAMWWISTRGIERNVGPSRPTPFHWSHRECTGTLTSR